MSDDSRFEPNNNGPYRRMIAKRVTYLVVAVAVFGMSCFGAMDSPDFVPHNPYDEVAPINSGG